MSTNTMERSATSEADRRRRWGLVAAAAGLIVAVIVAAVLFLPGRDAEPALELSLGGGESLASCLVFDVATLAQMSPAFEGTVTNVDGERITLDVDRWFAGGDAEQVTLIGTAGMEALIGGIAFQEGGQYLITAADGQVNYCGYSGPATPELRAQFEQAFGA